MMARKPAEVRAMLERIAATGGERLLTKREKGAVTGYLNKAVGGDQNRYLLLAWLFSIPGLMSSQALSEARWCALWEWLSFWQDDDGWHADERFYVESALCFTEALKEQAAKKPDEKDTALADDQSMIVQAAGFLGGVVTQVDGQESPGVAAPMDQYTRKKIMDFLAGEEDL